MPAKPTTKYIAVYMSDDAINMLKIISRRRGYKAVGEYVRDLIRRDVEDLGEKIDFGLDEWGGSGRQTQAGEE